MKNRKAWTALLSAGIVLLAACSTLRPLNDETLQSAGIGTTRDSSDESYLRLISRYEGGRYGPVVIFIERHNSRLIQAEIALGLYRLSGDYGLNRIALEGMFEGETLAGHQLPPVAGVDSRQTALTLLERGEIKAPEFMFLAKDSDVFGIEKESEYSTELPDDMDATIDSYLIVSSVVDAGWERAQPFVHTLLTTEDAREAVSAFESLLDLSPWTQEVLNTFADADDMQYSVRANIEILTRLRDKCKPDINRAFRYGENYTVFIDAETEEHMDRVIAFYETAGLRSLTMAESVARVLKNKNGPLAMVIGAGHTEGVEAYFREHSVSYYVLEPRGLFWNDDPSNLPDEAYARRNRRQPVSGFADLSRFLGIELNSRPTLTEAWLKKQAAVDGLLARTAAAAERSPGDSAPFGLTAAELRAEGVQILQETMERLGDGSILLAMEHEGQRLYFRVKAGEGFNPAAIASIPDIETALTGMIDRLYNYRDIPPPAGRRIAAFSSPAVKISGLIATDPDLIRSVDMVNTI